MVPVEQLKAAVEQLPKWSPQITSQVGWVNWRQGFQIKALWYGNCSLLCYLDFKDRVARDDTLATAFKRFAAPGARPRVIHGHGWSSLDYSFQSDHFVSINELAEIADAKGYAYTVLYVQECVGARPLFEILGIPLVPGEMGKEWWAASSFPTPVRRARICSRLPHQLAGRHRPAPGGAVPQRAASRNL